jgi:hypothetical protein
MIGQEALSIVIAVQGNLIGTDLWRDQDGAEGARPKAINSQAKGQSIIYAKAY